jgi:hypothetical protein
VTIILSVATPLYAIQVSDRLLTLQVGNRYEPWDPTSNKTIILLARDGLVSLGYSGPAHIYGATMDGWIAGVLSGEDVGADRPRPNFGLSIGGTTASLPLHTHLNAVTDRLNEAVKAAKVPNKLSITYVGLRWNSLKKPAWPAFGRIGWDARQAAYAMAMSKRRWPPGTNYAFGASGRSRARAQTMLRQRLSRTDLVTKEETTATLIDILRALPPNDPTVGKDCLITTVEAVAPHLHVKYEPYDIRQISVAFTGRTVIKSAAFTPWIVTPGLVASPQAVAGSGARYQSGLFEFSVEGPEPDGDLTVMSSLERRLRR